MKLPHFYDYVFSDDDALVDAKFKLAVIVEQIYDEAYEKKFIIRKIHHIGYHLFLGGQETVEAYFYDKPDGEDGTKSLITADTQFLIPRKISSTNSSKIVLTKKDAFKIKKNDILKEVILDSNNRPTTIDYVMEEQRGFAYEGRGQKGRYYIPQKDYEIVIMK